MCPRVARLPLLLLLACGEAPEQPAPVEVLPAPRIRFRDVTERLGELARVRLHVFGVALTDFTGDGALDLTMPHSDGIAFFRGDGAGGFVRHAAGDDAELVTLGRSAIYADIEPDGDLDLLVTTRTTRGTTGSAKTPVLLENRGDGTFVDSTVARGLARVGVWDGAAFGDLDGDDDLDLLLAGAFVAPGPGLAWIPGKAGSENFVYLNDGRGNFVEAPDGLGCKGPLDGESWGVRMLDWDLDGDLDVVIGNDSASSTYCENLGNGRLADVTAQEVATHGFSGFVGAMGLTVGDLNGDGCPDLYSTLFGGGAANAMSADGTRPNLYPAMVFGNPDPTAGISGWGACAFDPDLDGDQDLVWGGAADFLIPGSDDLVPGGMAVMENTGGGLLGRLRDASSEASPVFEQTHNAFGLARGDFDNDGDEDLFVGEDSTVPPVGEGYAESLLLENVSETNGRGVLRLTLRQAGKNPRAIGATVIVSVEGRRSLYSIAAGDSYLSSHGDALHFGLGSSPGAEYVHIIWPGGATQTLRYVGAGELTVVRGSEPCLPPGTCDGLVPFDCERPSPTTVHCPGTAGGSSEAACAELCDPMSVCGARAACMTQCTACPRPENTGQAEGTSCADEDLPPRPSR